METIEWQSKQASKQKFLVLWRVVKRKVKVTLGRHARFMRASRATIYIKIFCSRSPRKAGMTTSCKAGFTLVELSIVLVIIGLLAGGVLLGKDLIQAAEVRQQISQLEKLETEINTFKIKYNCLPGDCSNATDFLGTTYDGYGIFNGDGNGILNSLNGGNSTFADCMSVIPHNYAVTTSSTEQVQLFHHINASGIGSYFNKTTLTPWGIFLNLPHDVWGTYMLVQCLSDPAWMAITAPAAFTHGTAILIGATAADPNYPYAMDRVAYSMAGAPLFGGQPLQIPSTAARNIDTKIDDAMPLTGKVGVFNDCNRNNHATSYGQIADDCNVSMVKKLWE